MTAGKLYIVATPIGNLGDMTLRAIETLKSVDLIAAEDTRHTGILLKHFGISGRQIPYHEHNEKIVVPQLLAQLLEGKNIALVCDAGTPGIADAGFLLVRECQKNSIEIFPIPGASSLLAALVIAGLPIDRFCFEGFLPRSSGRLKSRLTQLKEDEHTLVFFESPHRVIKSLPVMLEVLGDRPAFIGRELTKKFEQSYRGTISQLLDIIRGKPVKGELVLIVAGYRKGIDERKVHIG
jgi:16S rRNA (cytidine1402-2'-O)-methyltransferase